MSHLEKHPDSGKIFKINLGPQEDLKAIYDITLNGQEITLVDWADRLEIDDDFRDQSKNVGLMFFIHRCFPDFEPEDWEIVSIKDIDLDGVVYGWKTLAFEDNSIQEIVLVRESELQSVH